MAKILLADDDPDYTATFGRAMDALGHRFASVATGEDIAAAVVETRPDIVFLDVLMPGGGAISRLHELRAAHPHLPIVVITGNAAVYDSPIVTEGMRTANARVPKTISLLQLAEIIDRLTG
ncbi:response regulator [Wenxinia marina]|uniref:response regulator n=1 Tax=Wenxinia marina TaxID=390641 RepID=UPI000593F8C5|nr:response regulator [Wenxinia marina]